MIYHYTTIETLDLILTSKKIRFNNLNDVDDKNESNLFLKKSLSQFIFVSCWTKEAEENVPLWMMYAKGKGVRIALPDYPWRKIDCKNWKVQGMQIRYDPSKEYISPFQFDDIFAESHVILAPYNMPVPNSAFAKQVIYLNTKEELAQKYLKIYSAKIDNDKFEIQIAPLEFGLYKHVRWAFQNEFRFVLWIFPLTKKLDLSIPNFHETIVNDMYQFIENEQPIQMKDYYLSLSEEAIQNIEIMAGPICGSAEEKRINELIQKHGLSTVLQKSQSEIRG